MGRARDYEFSAMSSSASGDGSGTWRGDMASSVKVSRPRGTSQVLMEVSYDGWRWNGLRVCVRGTGEPERTVRQPSSGAI